MEQKTLKNLAKAMERKTVANLRKKVTLYVSGKDILDDGCGRGSFIYSEHRDKKIQGIDVRKHLDFKGNFTLASSTKIPFGKDSFDCVVFAGVIQYVEDYEKALQEISRVLRKNGRLIMAVVNTRSLFRRLRLINPAPKKHAGEHNMFSFEKVKKLLERHNLQIEQVKGVDFMPMPQKLCSNTLIIARNVKM